MALFGKSISKILITFLTHPLLYLKSQYPLFNVFFEFKLKMVVLETYCFFFLERQMMFPYKVRFSKQDQMGLREHFFSPCFVPNGNI